MLLYRATPNFRRSSRRIHDGTPLRMPVARKGCAGASMMPWYSPVQRKDKSAQIGQPRHRSVPKLTQGKGLRPANMNTSPCPSPWQQRKEICHLSDQPTPTPAVCLLGGRTSARTAGSIDAPPARHDDEPREEKKSRLLKPTGPSPNALTAIDCRPGAAAASGRRTHTYTYTYTYR